MMVFTYIAAITIANLLVWWLGPWWSIVNSLLLIGLDLTLRDKLHDKYGAGAALVLVVAAGGLSYMLNPASANIAIASVVSFIAAGFADTATYSALINRKPTERINGSNIAGAAVDSILFPTLAFGSLMPQIVLAQFVAKVLGGAVAEYLMRKFAK